MVSLSLVKRWSIRAAAVAALAGLDQVPALADGSPWLILQTAGSNSSGELFDTYLINGASTGVTSSSPCIGQNCLPGSQQYSPVPTPGAQQPIAPQPTEPSAPSEHTPPMPEMSETPPSIQPPSTVPPFSDNQSNFVDFGQGLGSQTLLASRDVPAMVGDYFGAGLMQYSGYGGNFMAPDASTGAYGRLKFAENTNPVPTDRLYANYSYFNNTIIGGIDVNRVTLGAEKTFFNQMMSIEIRLPIISTLSEDIVAFGTSVDYNRTDTSDTQIGDLQLYLKGVIWEGENGLISGGLGITLPTADDMTFGFPGGSTYFVAENQAVHLLPFVGGVYTPNDRLFATTMLQLDIDANGQMIYDGFSAAGRLRDHTFMFLSQGLGFWMVRNPGFRLAPIAEVHLNQTLSGSSTAGGVATTVDNVTIVNGVIGLTSVLNERFRLTAAYVTPLGVGSSDEQFDGEFRLIFNWYYGAQPNAAQAGFFN